MKEGRPLVHQDASLYELITHTFATIEAKDLDTLLRVSADDAVVIDSHFQAVQLQGKAAITEGLREAIAGMQSFVYAIMN
jgi:ketosteroid isomerase-like protein